MLHMDFSGMLFLLASFVAIGLGMLGLVLTGMRGWWRAGSVAQERADAKTRKPPDPSGALACLSVGLVSAALAFALITQVEVHAVRMALDLLCFVPLVLGIGAWVVVKRRSARA